MQVISELLQSQDVVIRYKTRLQILGEDADSPELCRLQLEIPRSPRVAGLFSDRGEKGEIPFHPYTKWQGAHWVLTCLVDTGYPPGDDGLIPLRDQVYAWLFSDAHIEEIHKRTGKNRQVRLHASMEGNALYASIALGLTDSRTGRLVERLLWAQWEDGGWNCDRKKKADSSSFYESITPLRGLAAYAGINGDEQVRAAVERAAEIFLKRHLFLRVSDGSVMNQEFLKLRFPAYHFYNILWALKIMGEAGYLHDPRCQQALDLLQSKQLADGSFAAEGKYYYPAHKPAEITWYGSRVNWGPTGRGKSNEYITLEALAVLRTAGRLSPP